MVNLNLNEHEASVVRRSNRLKKSNPRYVNTIIVSEVQEPKSYDQACDVPEWIAAMKEEILALMKNQT